MIWTAIQCEIISLRFSTFKYLEIGTHNRSHDLVFSRTCCSYWLASNHPIIFAQQFVFPLYENLTTCFSEFIIFYKDKVLEHISSLARARHWPHAIDLQLRCVWHWRSLLLFPPEACLLRSSMNTTNWCLYTLSNSTSTMLSSTRLNHDISHIPVVTPVISSLAWHLLYYNEE